MRLRCLNLTRYGKFTDKVLDFGEKPASGPDFHLVYGPNEAGKSTAFDGYLSLLFGIEARSQYNFLHDYKSMLVGGCLETQGRVFDLSRTKGNANDLRTASGDLIPASALGQILGGLTRETYRAMFSLDNYSLEEGGRAIVESKGELGQLLFAASSGLSKIARDLGLIRETADTLFKPRGRTTKIRELLDKLDELKKQKAAIDVAASRYDKMKLDVEKTRQAFELAQTEFDTADKIYRELQRLSTSWPLAVKYRARQGELLPLALLPTPPQDWSKNVDQFASDEATYEAQQRSNATLALRLESELHNLSLNDALLNAAEQINSLDLPRSRFSTADIDLPRRIASLAAEQVDIANCLTSLGEPATTEPSSLILNQRITARLIELANNESILASALTFAEAEVTQATKSLEEAEAEAEDETEKDHSAVIATSHSSTSLFDTSVLQALLARLTSENSTNTLAQLRDNIREDEERMTTLTKKLRPFLDDVKALAALEVPSIEQMERQATAFKVAEDDVRLASTRLAEHEEQAARFTARAKTLGQQAGLIDNQTMANLADARAKAWRLHVSELGRETSERKILTSSADRYELTAEIERNALSSKIRQSEKLGEWNAASLSQAEADAALTATTAHQNTAKLALQNLCSHLASELSCSNLPSGWHVEEFVEWLKCRDEVLTLSETIARKHARCRELETQIAQDAGLLIRELGALSMVQPVGSTLPQMMGLAQRALTIAATAREKREGSARALAKLHRDLNDRKAQLNKTMLAYKDWQKCWSDVLKGTWLMQGKEERALPTLSVAEMRKVLEVLDELGQTLERKAQLSHQIDSMQLDQSAYIAKLQSACVASSQPFDAKRPMESASALASALSDEIKKQSLKQSKTADIDRARNERQSISDAKAKLAVQQNQMFTYFSVIDMASLRQALQQANHAIKLRGEIADLEREMILALHTPDLTTALAQIAEIDADAIEAKLAQLELSQNDANTQLLELNHARRSAEKLLADVSADETTARLRETQRTIELEIQETGLRYLRLRIGINAVEAALRIYRDQHRSSMLQDAAKRFKSLTAGNFTDLQTQPTEKGESLLGVQSTGRSILADAMSKGTRDQLFLALRMAGYMEFAKTRDSLPFIADDIMETFDNERASATFAMFQQVAHHGQVIYLTHHEHLCTIARSVCGSAVRITQL